MVSFMETKTVKTVKSRTQQRAKKTRRRLKKAALDVFSEKSVDAATVEEITEKADLGKGTLYQHFTHKEQMVATLVEEAVEHLVERMWAYESSPKNLDEMLVHLLDAHYRFFADCREEFLLLFQGKLLLKLESDIIDELGESYLRYLKEIEQLVTSYLPAKTEPEKIRRFACAVAGFVFGYFSFAMIGLNVDEMETNIEPLRRVFVKSLSEFLE
jgi:AcrR family transcriptional regulator